MLYRLAADFLVLVHLAFVLYVVLGGLLVSRWPRSAWAHLPAAGWGVLIELMGWVCPLTPLENALRARGGQAGYPGGFIEHYLLPVLYPAGLNPRIQIGLGLAALAFNVAVYGTWIVRRRASRAGSR